MLRRQRIQDKELTVPRKKLQPPKVIIYPTRVSTEGIDTRKNLVESAFVTLRNGLAIFSTSKSELLPELELRPELKDIPKRVIQLTPRHHHFIGYEALSVTVASDGFVLEKLTKNNLADHAHQLRVPNFGVPEYHRRSFNVDAQAVPAKDIDLTGVEHISRDPTAVVELLAFERDVVYGALTNWGRDLLPASPEELRV